MIYIRQILLALLCLSSLIACVNVEQKQAKMPSIMLENGMQLNSCKDYEQARSAFRIAETLSNQLISAEYLICSLSLPLVADDDNTQTMRAIFHQLKLRALPTSLSSSSNVETVLSARGFQLWLEKGLLTYEDEFTIIQIQYKGKLKNGNHLVWVSDKATQGNYMAFFPAIIMFEGGEVTGAAPLYASGF